MTLRWRLSIALVLAVTLGAATFGLVARAVVQHQLYHDVDDALRTEVARLVGDLDGPSRDGPFARRGRRGGDGPGSFFGRNALFAQVIADDGTVISRTTAVDAIGGLPQPRLGDARDGELHLRTVRIDHERYRLAEARVADGATVQVARPLTELAGFLDTLLRVLVAAGGLAIGAALLLGPWAARATLRPVERMTRTAQSIANEPHDLSARVEPAFPDPELREFADAINEMLASIEDADRHQRRFVADASHELRTPLTSLGGNASWLAARESLDRDEREAIESVGRDVARLVRIADGLTVLARLDAAPAPQLEPVDVDAAVRESIDRARRVHPDHSFEADELGCGTQVLDAELVRRILDNLLDNAGRYTPRGSTVAVTVGVAADGQIELAVIDDGPGIPADERDEVRRRFHRGSTSTGASGTGLGLAIVDEAARSLGGSLHLDDGPDGHGLACTVLLRSPRAADG